MCARRTTERLRGTGARSPADATVVGHSHVAALNMRSAGSLYIAYIVAANLTRRRRRIRIEGGAARRRRNLELLLRLYDCLLLTRGRRLPTRRRGRLIIKHEMSILRGYVEVYLERGDERGRFIQCDLRRLERLAYARLLLNGLAWGSEGPQNAP